MFACFTNWKGAAILGVAIAGAIYLVLWHGSHLAAVAPLLIVVACPLMHLLGHGGHHRGPHGAPASPATRDNPHPKEP